VARTQPLFAPSSLMEYARSLMRELLTAAGKHAATAADVLAIVAATWEELGSACDQLQTQRTTRAVFGETARSAYLSL